MNKLLNVRAREIYQFYNMLPKKKYIKPWNKPVNIYIPKNKNKDKKNIR